MSDDEDDEEILNQLCLMSRRSADPTPPDKWIPGRKVQVLTTNSPKPDVLPKASKKARAAISAVESLKEKRDRLRREIAELEGRRGKS